MSKSWKLPSGNYISSDSIVVGETDSSTRHTLTTFLSPKYFYSLNTSKTIATNSDLNNITEQGIYACRTNALAQSLSNCPVTVGFELIVHQNSLNSPSIFQLIQTYNGLRYSRYFGTWLSTDGAWSSWVQNPRESDITSTINSSLNSFWTTQNFTKDNWSISANNYDYADFTVTKSGYTPIGIVSTYLANASSSGTGGASAVLTQSAMRSSTVARVQIRNTGSSTMKILVTLKILYLKNM